MEDVIKAQQAVGRLYRWIAVCHNKRDTSNLDVMIRSKCPDLSCNLQGQYFQQHPKTYVFYYYCPKCHLTWYIDINES
jgi:hypothetical protein